jgi:hypothetical protein
MTMQFRIIASKTDRTPIDFAIVGPTNEKAQAKAELAVRLAQAKGYTAHIRIEAAK